MKTISSKCEKCNKEHFGKYATGRFCSKGCANARIKNRKDINEKISKALKGRKLTTGGFKKGYDSNRIIWTQEKRRVAALKRSETMLKKSELLSWEEAGITVKRQRVKTEQNEKCNKCGIKEWRGKWIVLEIEHIDANPNNWERSNVEGLCPNCHSQTKSWRRKKSSVYLQEYFKEVKKLKDFAKDKYIPV